MTQIEKARRPVFEKIAESMEMPVNRTASGKYYNAIYTEGAWIGFNMALDSICIKLPEEDVNGKITWTGAMRAIEQAGLGIRINDQHR